MIKRYHDLGYLLAVGKVLIVYGPRRVGKTSLANVHLDSARLKNFYEVGADVKQFGMTFSLLFLLSFYSSFFKSQQCRK